jgi:hypothetical protein
MNRALGALLGRGFAINVHDSPGVMRLYIACGEIE